MQSKHPAPSDVVRFEHRGLRTCASDKELALASVELEKKRLEYKLAKLSYQRDVSHGACKWSDARGDLDIDLMENGRGAANATTPARPAVASSSSSRFRTAFLLLTSASAFFTLLCLVGFTGNWSGESCITYQHASSPACSAVRLPPRVCVAIDRLAYERSIPNEVANSTSRVADASSLSSLSVGDYAFGASLTNARGQSLRLSESNGAILGFLTQVLLLLTSCATPIIAMRQSFQTAKWNAALGSVLAIVSCLVYYADRGPSSQVHAFVFGDAEGDCVPHGSITLRPGWTWGWLMNLFAIGTSVAAFAVAHVFDKQASAPVKMVDPIAYVFSYAPAAWGNVSYGQYVLQIICYNVWPLRVLGVTVIPFFVFLLSLSWLSAELVTDPARSWWLQQKGKTIWRVPKLAFMPCLTAGVLLLIGVPYNATRPGRAAVQLAPPYVIASNASDGTNLFVDVRLNWTAPEFDRAGGDERALINPSVAVIQPSDNLRVLVRAARAHAVVESVSRGTWEVNVASAGGEPSYEARQVTEITHTWRSDIVVAKDLSRFDLSGWDVAAWGLDGNAPMQRKTILPTLPNSTGDDPSWGPLCEAEPTFIPQNSTLVRKVVTGAEDPKLLSLRDQDDNVRWGLTFSSLPPVTTSGACYQGGPRLRAGDVAGAAQMYIAPETRTGDGISWPAAPVVASRLECGESVKAEKNWIGFTHHGQLHYIYSVFPHRVVVARSEDGGCYEYPRYTEYPALRELANAGYRLHGSATAIEYKGTYVALLHTIDNLGRYTTMAYRFQPEPPFAITAVSQPLPLQGVGMRNFASGLLVESGKVMVSYGEQDAAARALVMSTEFFDSLFQEKLHNADDPNVVLS